MKGPPLGLGSLLDSDGEVGFGECAEAVVGFGGGAYRSSRDELGMLLPWWEMDNRPGASFSSLPPEVLQILSTCSLAASLDPDFCLTLATTYLSCFLRLKKLVLCDVPIYPCAHTTDIPEISTLSPLLRLKHLQLHNCTLRHGSVHTLCKALTSMQSLSLQGGVTLSHESIKAFGLLSDLQSLSLGKVQLIFDRADMDDSPEPRMTDLYSVLNALPDFTSLSFQLAEIDRTRYLHSAYLLGLYESGINTCLRSLELSTIIFDSDYSFLLLASISHLTSLKCTYMTWPLCLGQHDLSLLAPLSQLRVLRMHCADDEEHHLLALTSHVLQTLCASWTSIECFHYSGQILLDTNNPPDLRTWTSLVDLSLCHVGQGADLEASIGSAPYARRGLSADAQYPASRVPPLGLKRTLPTFLVKLSLAGISVQVEDMIHLRSCFRELRSLALTDCGITLEHLTLVDMGSESNIGKLEVLVVMQVDCGITLEHLTVVDMGAERKGAERNRVKLEVLVIMQARGSSLEHLDLVDMGSETQGDLVGASSACNPTFQLGASATGGRSTPSDACEHERALLHQAIASLSRLSHTLEYLILGLPTLLSCASESDLAPLASLTNLKSLTLHSPSPLSAAAWSEGGLSLMSSLAPALTSLRSLRLPKVLEACPAGNCTHVECGDGSSSGSGGIDGIDQATFSDPEQELHRVLPYLSPPMAGF
eukprot:gene30882-35930_t